MKTDLIKSIFKVKNQSDFLKMAMEIFEYQYLNNSVYQLFTNSLGRKRKSVNAPEEIPFLPVEFFRNHKNPKPVTYSPFLRI